MTKLYKGYSKFCGKTRTNYLSITAAIDAANRALVRKLGVKMSNAYSTFAVDEAGCRFDECGESWGVAKK